MQSRLIFGMLLLFCLILFACGPEPIPAAFAKVTVFAPAVESPSVAFPDPTSALVASAAVAASDLFLVVYEKSGSLWISRSGALAQITSGTQDTRPKISADGQLLVFQRGAELWMVDISGDNLRKVFAEQDAQPLQFEFAPGSHLLYFNTSSTDGTPRDDLYQADPITNILHILLPKGQAGKFTFAPNGSVMALVQSNKIMTVRSDGSDLRQVYQFEPAQAVQGAYYPPIAWLDNAYGFKTVIPGSAGQPARLIFIIADGSPAAQLAQFSAVSPALSDVYIAPDGSKVVYLQQQGDNLELHVIDASTADRLVFSQARGTLGLLGWTPDSQGLLVWLNDSRSAWLLTGQNQVGLSDTVFAENLTWLSNDSVLFMSEGGLRFRRLGQPSQVIDEGVTSYSAVLLR